MRSARLPLLDTFLQDLRYGWRGILRAPAFSLVVILTLALGIGANTAIFSVVRAVILKPLPYPKAERIVWLGESAEKATGISVTWGNFQHWLADNHTLETMAGFQFTEAAVSGSGEPRMAFAAMVGRDFFRILGMRPTLGREFTPGDEAPSAPSTAILSYRNWVDRFGANPAVLGTTLSFGGKPYEIIGVAAPLWTFYRPVDLYLPLERFHTGTAPRGQHGSMRALGVLKPGITLESAESDLDAVMRHLAEQDPGPEDHHRSYGEFLAGVVTRSVRPALLILMAAVGLVFLIACANVASVELSRAAVRAPEIAVRAAMGAGRMRIVRQLLTENLLLAALGATAGLLMANASMRVLIAMAPRNIPRLAETQFDPAVLAFAAAVTILTSVFISLAPVWSTRKLDLISTIKDGSRTAGSSSRGQSLRGLLVAAEIAVTVVLTFAAGLLIRSLIAAETSSPGFAPDHLLVVDLALAGAGPRYKGAAEPFYNHLIEDLRTLPGATEVAATGCPPTYGDCGDGFYSIADRPAPAPGEMPIALFNIATPGYFQTMRIPVREGRSFSQADRSGALPVAIVNQALARQWWPNESPVGHRIKPGGPNGSDPPCEIVGVVGNVGQNGLDADPLPEIFFPFAQSPRGSMHVMIRTAGDPELLSSAVRLRIAAIDRSLPIEGLGAFEKIAAATLDRRKFSTLLLAIFAGLAVLLAAVGIYGMLSYWVASREPEIAIRLALGAQRSKIVLWAGWRVAGLVAFGIAAGSAGAWAASHFIESMVFGISPWSISTLLMSLLVVIGIALAACAIPLSRTLRVDTARQLHHS